MTNINNNIIPATDFLVEVVNMRLNFFFEKNKEIQLVYPHLNITENGDELSKLLIRNNLGPDEFIILMLALAPHIQPNFFESIIQQYLPQGGDFPEFGGVKGTNYRGMLPTGETAQFIIAGNDFNKRIYVQKLLLTESILAKEQILSIERVKEGEPIMSGRIILDGEWLNKLLTGADQSPMFNTEFPAKKVATNMSWDDLVLNGYTQKQVEDIQVWLQHNKRLMQDDVLRKKIKPGYRVLFYGPPGTGKTLTVTLLGKQFNKDVYRIDLSQIVSKYIGETEKNLEKVFEKAMHKDWILFFDEADALFGKRTGVQSSHDRYANQEVSYLLQRIEDFPGLLILASNFKTNMDDAFLRRFHTVVHFPAPNVNERFVLWQKSLPASFKIDSTVNLNSLSEKYELTGAAILNIVHYATLQTAAKKEDCIQLADILEGIKREYRKEEKTINF
jgi:AAA+ superfamily predicted ATPase